MTDPTPDDFKRMLQAGNDAAQEAFEMHPKPTSWAMNCADFSCYAAVYELWLNGDDRVVGKWRLEFMEAAPTAIELQKWLSEHIKRATGLDVEVTTEW